MIESVPPERSDSAIAEFIAKSSKLSNYRKNSHIFVIVADFLQILGLGNAHSVKERLFLRSKNLMNSLVFSSCSIYKSYIGRTNPRFSFGLHGAERLSARTGAAGCSRSRDTIIHSAGRYSETSSQIHSGINNISVKSCEKHYNSAQNSVKATDIRTNSTVVETKKTYLAKALWLWLEWRVQFLLAGQRGCGKVAQSSWAVATSGLVGGF